MAIFGFLNSYIQSFTWTKARDTRNGCLLCDFKDKSGTFNGHDITIPGQGTIKAYSNKDGTKRTTEVADMIKLAVNHWRATKQRVLYVSKIRSWMRDSAEIKSRIPNCP